MGKRRNSTTPALSDAQRLQIKRDNFARVLPPRIDKALKAIRMVGDCTLPTYTYTSEQATSIVNMLVSAVAEVGDRFAGVPGKTGGFKLPS